MNTSKYSKTQCFMLYALGKWFEEANIIVADRPLQVSISKNIFIDVIKNSGIALKQERAIYKNLQILEESKLLAYQNSELKLTKKGEKLYHQIKKDIEPYINVEKKLRDKSPISYTKKIQTVFR